MRAALIWCPFGTAAQAQAVARQLLSERLVAGANILPAITSVFSWQGEIQSGEEVAVLFKTDAALLDAATARLEQLHPYDTPAIAGWAADSTPPVTGKWLADTLAEGGDA